MALIVAAVLLLIFVANVVIGSIAGNPILGNVGEMLLLMSASIAFVFEILKREAKAKASNTNDT